MESSQSFLNADKNNVVFIDSTLLKTLLEKKIMPSFDTAYSYA